MRKKVLIFVIGLAGVIILFISFTAFQVLRYSTIDSNNNADAIVVLGAAEYAGKPSPVFKARLDHAYNLFEMNRAPIIVTTGGAITKEEKSESRVGKNYLMKLGVPENVIFIEEESQTTKQNLDRTKEIAQVKKIASVILVSDPFHMYRAKIIAEDLGFITYTSPTTTSPIAKNKRLNFQYIVRETALSILHIIFDV